MSNDQSTVTWEDLSSALSAFSGNVELGGGQGTIYQDQLPVTNVDQLKRAADLWKTFPNADSFGAGLYILRYYDDQKNLCTINVLDGQEIGPVELALNVDLSDPAIDYNESNNQWSGAVCVDPDLIKIELIDGKIQVLVERLDIDASLDGGDWVEDIENANGVDVAFKNKALAYLNDKLPSESDRNAIVENIRTAIANGNVSTPLNSDPYRLATYVAAGRAFPILALN